MPYRTAINGCGRIGRIFLKISYKEKDIDIVAINDITDAKTLAHLLKYDSVHGKFPGEIFAGDDFISVNGKKIKVLSEKSPDKLPWKDMNIDFVIESTGVFRSYEGAELHIKAGAKRVIITAPGKGKTHIPTFVMGVNESSYDPSSHRIISNASCTTNCLAIVAKVIDDNFGIKKAFMSTVHSYTADQRIVDLPHKDFRRARAAALSMIPTTTGAAKALAEVIPHLKGKFEGIAIRVPTPNISIIDLSCIVEKETTVEEVNKVFEREAKGRLSKYLEYRDEPLVSTDFIGNPASAIFDSLLTSVVGKDLVKVFAWYDNEFGYAARVKDLLLYIGSRE